MTDHREPPRNSQKGKVLEAGFNPSGGSISQMQQILGGCTERNVTLHIEQCKKWYGLNIKINGDRFYITGDIPVHWKMWNNH